MHPQPRPFTLQLFLDFWAIFSPDGPSIFFVHDSPSNLSSPGSLGGTQHIGSVFVVPNGSWTGDCKVSRLCRERKKESVQAGLPCYCTPPVTAPDVIGARVVWRQNKTKTKNVTKRIETWFAIILIRQHPHAHTVLQEYLIARTRSLISKHPRRFPRIYTRTCSARFAFFPSPRYSQRRS